MARYRVKDWSTQFEKNRTRELKRMEWVAVPNRMDGRGYTALVDHPRGDAHLGAWLAILEIASRSTTRGEIPQDGAANTETCLARISRLPVMTFMEVLPRLVDIGWIECFQQDGVSPQDPAEIPHPTAESAHYREGNGSTGKGMVGTVPVDWSTSRISEETRKRKLTDLIATQLAPTENPLTVEELDTAWEMHHKPRGEQPRVLVFQRIVGMNGAFDLERFRQRHRIFCEYWDRRDWTYCPLSFLDWVEQGMPLPPPEPRSNRKKSKNEELLEEIRREIA